VVAGGGPYSDETAEAEDLAAGEWVLFEPEQGMSEVLNWMAHKLRFKPRVAARVGQVAAALNLAIEGVGLAVVPENAVPHAWRDRVRRFKPPLYREIVAYSRSSLPQLARRYVDLLGSVELPLTKAEDIEDDAFTR
jgi:DNA-binding transcriptional LysR family regulator